MGLIEHLDDGIGKVLATLDRTGLASNTLAIFCSDNGGVLANGANNGPWRSGKQHVYEGGLRVPGVRVENIATTGKTMPDFDIRWTEMVGLPLAEDGGRS